MNKSVKENKRKNMQAVKSKGSKIEKMLAHELWKRGYRYQKNYSKIFGKPDLVFKSLKIAIFCDSEFWHGHDWKNRSNDFKSNRNFWIPKIERNIERDKEVNIELKKQGWKVLRFWGKDIKNNTKGCVDKIEELIKNEKLLDEIEYRIL